LTRGFAAGFIFASAFAVSCASPAFGTVPTTHTVTFIENDSGSDPVSSFQASASTQNLTLFANLNPSFSNSGHTFDGWNTSANGSGTSYSDGESYSFASDLELYAQWTQIPTNFTVTFVENDSGSDPVSAVQANSSAHDLTLFSNLSPSFSNSGHTFIDWNTSADGSGTSYSDGESYSFTADIELYAQWSASVVTANFSNNGGTGAIASVNVTAGTSVTLPSGSALAMAGAVFNDWNTAANGSGTSYQPGATVVLNANETFYAQWTPAVEISFSANGGVGSISQLSGQAGTSVALPPATNLSYGGFSFATWNTVANGSGTTYVPGQSVILTTSLTLYAQWTPTATIAVSFSANGGNGSLATLTGATGTTVTLPSSSSVVRPGYSFTSWNTAANGSGVSYAAGQNFTLSTSVTLFAQWKATPTSSLYGTIGDFSKNVTSLNASLKAQVTRLASVVKKKQYDVIRLFGYSADTGFASLNGAVSSARANSVASFLASRLKSMKVENVKISVSGEGAVPGRTSSIYSCVEVFVQ
jgi:uncharacterized repeat protein (TIGR02543 family)